MNSNADAMSRKDEDEKAEEETMTKEDLTETLIAIVARQVDDKIVYYDDALLEGEAKDLAVCAPSDFKDIKFGILRRILDQNGQTKQLKKRNNKIGSCVVNVGKDGRITAYLITKRSNLHLSNLDILENCLIDLVSKLKKLNIEKITIPKVGYGLEKFKWDEVCHLINKHLVGNGISVDTYTNKKERVISSIEEEKDNLSIEEELIQLQKQDSEIQCLREKHEDKLKGFVTERGVLLKLRKGKNGRIFRQIVVPVALKRDIMESCHDDFTGGHMGEKKTWTKLSNRYFWPNYFRETKDYVMRSLCTTEESTS